MSPRNRNTQPESTQDEGGVTTLDETTETGTETESNGNGETAEAEQKGYAEYKLAGDIPSALIGKLIRTPEKYTIESFKSLVQDGDEKHIVSLAQAQFDIIIQRALRNEAAGEEVAKLLKEGDVDGAVAVIQARADGYVYGSRPAAKGETAQTRKAKANQKKLQSAAAADPALAARLAELGVEL